MPSADDPLTAAPLSYTPLSAADYLLHTAYNRSPIHRNRLACIVGLLAHGHAASAPLRILDIGCGVGNICIPLASLGHQVVGMDIHAPSVEQARRNNPFPNLTLAVGSFETADLGRFDAIILTEVLEHVTPFREMMQALAARMRPGARLILTVPNGWSLTELVCRPSYSLKQRPGGVHIVHRIKKLLGAKDLTTANEQTPHLNFFTLGRLRQLIRDSGLRVVVFHRAFFLWPLYETFFSTRKLPEGFARRDFLLSQRLPPACCAFWAFLLTKDGPPADPPSGQAVG